MFNHKVMIVDTDEKFLGELEKTLTLSGYDTIVAQDPYLALAIASSQRPHAILLGLKMPGKNGFQLAYELKSHSELQHIPVIAMTKFFKDGYKNLMDMCGIEKCLKIPFNPLDVITKIESILEPKSEII